MDTPVTETRPQRSWNTGKLCNIAGALAWQAGRQPEAIAVRYPQRALPWSKPRYAACTYRELNELTDDYARGLAAHGIAAGTRTALMLRPGLDFIAVFFALFKAGAVPVLIDPGIDRKALLQCLAEAAPEAFIGVWQAQLARRWFGWAKDSCQHFVTAAPRGLPAALGGGVSLRALRRLGAGDGPMLHPVQPDDIAAILFTSGSTGIPKGVVYRHRHFAAQVEMLREAFAIEPGEVSLQTFPPFALFDPALGMTTVVPDMDPTRPADADPRHLADIIEEFQVTSVFGSPALLDPLSRHAEGGGKRMWSVRRVISAGAAVPIGLVRRLERSLANDALIHTPYGATECLPVTNVTNREQDSRVEALTESGEGILVGRPVAGNEVRVVRISDNAFDGIADTTPMPPGMPGEIIVRGPSCTDAYWGREAETRMAKIADGTGGWWHRMGDAGILDGEGRLWFCGRVSQRVETGQETLFAEQAEAIFNQHPDAARTALVGVGTPGRQIPVLCVEPRGKLTAVESERLHFDLLQLAQAHALTRSIRTVLFHPGLPVDIRHNAKIGREELARWATQRMQA